MSYHDAAATGQDALRDGQHDRPVAHLAPARALGHDVRRQSVPARAAQAAR
jgi:hypothetical protein